MENNPGGEPHAALTCPVLILQFKIKQTRTIIDILFYPG